MHSQEKGEWPYRHWPGEKSVDRDVAKCMMGEASKG